MSDGPNRGAGSPTRYWLKNAPLLGGPDGAEIRLLEGPVQVELFDNGRVRSVAGARDRFFGYLPRELYAKPHRDRGLLLYVQRVAELRLERPDGPIVGRVHPGALLTVTTEPGAQVAVGNLGFDEGGEWIGYVPRDALGVEPTELDDPPVAGPARGVVPPSPRALPFVREDGRGPLKFERCYPIWFPESGPPRQCIDGVELRGPSQGDIDSSDPVRVAENSAYCSATMVIRHGRRLFLVRPDGSETEVSEVPRGFTAVAWPDPASAPLNDAIMRGGSVYWLDFDHRQITCGEARFENGRHHTRTLKMGLAGQLQELGGDCNRYSVVYRLPYQPRLGQLLLSPAPKAERTSYGEYTVLGSDGDAWLVTGLPTREAAVAFAPGDAERWYFSREACERARDAITERMKRDPGVVVTAGFHVPIPAVPR